MDTYWDKTFENYKNSHTKSIADLEYLNLAGIEKVSNKDLAHNLHVNTYRSDLGFKVVISSLTKERKLNLQNKEELEKLHKKLELFGDLDKIVRSQRTELKKANQSLEDLNRELQALRSDYLSRRPLSKKDVEELVLRISEQPKLVEQQTEALTRELSEKVDKVEALIHRLEKVIIG
uniref:Uncharacterized protein n=1 Tax=Banana streak MY virus TaxID=1476909 RepID=X2F672_9VIRU|nr:hypothetical protein [Banana streak MY virus]